jgi:hypothetical protein
MGPRVGIHECRRSGKGERCTGGCRQGCGSRQVQMDWVTRAKASTAGDAAGASKMGWARAGVRDVRQIGALQACEL